MSESQLKTSFEQSPGRANGARQWFSRTFTAPNMSAFARTAAWVVPLTILIWVYAEREQAVEKPWTFPIAVRCADPSRIVRLLGDQSVSATLSGSKTEFERVTTLVSKASEEPAVQIDVDPRMKIGPHAIPTEKALSENPIFKGLTITNCTPQALQVSVDAVEEREMEVRTPSTVTNLASAPVYEPRTVKVRGPRAAFERARTTLSVEADLTGRDELRSAGTHEIASLPVRLTTDDPSITVQPTTVKATVEVSQSDARWAIASIPIWIASPPGFEKYKVDAPPVLTNITVIGPPDKIDLLKKRTDQPLVATLYVRREDIGKGQLDRAVELHLPDGVYVAKEDVAKLTISFKLTELSPSE